MRPYLIILDYETRSKANLKECGAFEYAADPSTEILCAVWLKIERIDGKLTPTKKGAFAPKLNIGQAEELKRDLLGAHVIVAHNAGFEQVITRFCLGLDLPPEKWECTAARAAAHSLPRSLDKVTEVLNLAHKKNPKGKLLIQRHCKPRKPTKNNPAIWNEDPQGLSDLLQYCDDDVAAEFELLKALPPLTPTERKVWCLDQKINQRGVKLDLNLVDNALKLADKTVHDLTERVRAVSGGLIESTGQRDVMLSLLQNEGLFITDLRAGTVEDKLRYGDLSAFARELLSIRKDASKTSVKKYDAFKARSRFDGVLRDVLLYHGASTGRFSGAGVQVQNFPRPVIKDAVAAAEMISQGEFDLLDLAFGADNIMGVLSSTLRSVLTARPGFKLHVGDYASIEVRVLFWLAEHAKGLELYHQKRDAYREMASIIFKVPLEQVTKAQREIGKRVILGAGYGMGAKKFKITCEQFGVDVTEDLAKHSIETYRSEHSPVPKLWRNLEIAAMQAAQNPGKVYRINKTKWFLKDRFLFCELPSGRRLAYPDPVIKNVKTSWGEDKPTLHHFGVDPLTKKWVLSPTYGGKLCENVTQAVARDLMAEAMLRLNDAGYTPLISVHDELVTEKPIGQGSTEEFARLMRALPAWAVGCPVEVDAWSGFRYRK